MLNIAAELGSYSIKITTYQIEKKRVKILSVEELALDFEESSEEIDFTTLWTMQLEQLSHFLSNLEFEYQLIMLLPGDLVTTRYLSLPIKNKKKAMQMLPFQIEEDLPYSLSDSHWAEHLKREGDLTHATVGIIKKDLFEQFYELLKVYQINPLVLTSDVAAYAQFIENHEADFEQSFCIIDMGHHSTKGYFFQDGLLVSNHQSYTAGKTIIEAISKTYDISEEEAIIYKHQNSFFLLKDQLDQVNENQKEFAKVMDSTMEPLVNELKRWDIGHRVKYSTTVKAVYLTGASVNIKNIDNYLTEKLGLPVKIFTPFQFTDSNNIEPDNKFRNKFGPVTTLSIASIKKTGLINYLKGDYVFSNQFGLPLHEFAFVFTRASIVAAVLSVYFLINGIIASSKVDKARRSAAPILKNPALALTSTQRARRPGDLLTLLQGKNKTIVQEIRSIQASLKTNALRHIQDIMSFIQGRNVEIVYFSAIEDTSASKDPEDLKHEIDFVLHASNIDDLKAVKVSFEQSSREWQISLDEKKNELSIKGLGVTE